MCIIVYHFTEIFLWFPYHSSIQESYNAGAENAIKALNCELGLDTNVELEVHGKAADRRRISNANRVLENSTQSARRKRRHQGEDFAPGDSYAPGDGS